MVAEAPYQRPSLGKAAWLGAGSISVALWLLLQPAELSVTSSFGLALAATALCAEPAALVATRKGPRFAVTVVFVGAMARFWSPAMALVVAVLASLIGSALVRRSLVQALVEAGAN